MQHISVPVHTALRRLNGATAGAVVEHPTTLPELAEKFERLESYDNPDVIVPVKTLRFDAAEEQVLVPELGAFRFTDWSRRQCASLLGIKFDRWFENAGDGERADEMNRRFARATGSVRLRTRRPLPNGHADDVGTLRAFVSPGYTPIRDSALARTMITALAPVDLELRLVRQDVTDRTTSYVVKVGKPYRIGDDAEVGDVWGGVLVRNSGVGFASLVLTLHLTRLLCKNGMTAPLPDAVLVRRRHIGLDGWKLTGILAERFSAIPGKLHRSAEILHEARSRRLEDVSIAVRTLLAENRLPLRLLDPILKAYDREPHPSAFGLSQAMTLAAQDLAPEDRSELERVAGEYVAEA